MTPVLANEAELYFERGGPVSRFVQRLALRLGLELTVRVRIVGFLLITWVPLLLFALMEGRAVGASPKESLLQDFATYARFFLAVPLLIVAELVVGPRLREAGLQFVHGGFIRPEDHAGVLQHELDFLDGFRSEFGKKIASAGALDPPPATVHPRASCARRADPSPSWRCCSPSSWRPWR